MKSYSQFLLTTIVISLFFLLFTVSFVAAADIADGNTIISISTTDPVTGNSDSSAGTDLTDPSIVPQAGDNSSVYDNHVTIKDTVRIDGNIYGGITYGNGVVYENTVTIDNGGLAALSVFGGWAGGDGNVSDNIVEISGSVFNEVYGGWAGGDGNAIGNSIYIESLGEANSIYGGRAVGDGNIIGNVIFIANNGWVNTIYGGHADGDGYVSGNTVHIASGGRVNIVYGGTSDGDGDVTDNSVSTASLSIANLVYGGQTDGGGNVSYNEVEINNAALLVYGGWADGDGKVSGNTVSITSAGSVFFVYGGWAGGDGNVSGNIVEISGNIFNEVYGGYSSGSGKVENNTVNITSTANLASASIYGFNTGATGMDNTLNVNSFSGNVVTIANFDNYNFVLGQLGSNLMVISITGTAVDIDNSNITISFSREFMNNNLSVGDNIIVIDTITNSNPNSTSVTIEQSPFIAYNFTETRNTQLSLTLNSMALQPQTKAVGEAFAAGLAFLGQAADLRSGLKLMSAGSNFAPFAAMTYGSQYISTGSSVNVKGFSALAGLALNTSFDNGRQLVVGAFIEGGRGNYNSRNSFNNFSTVKGKGDTEYYGGGVLARYAMASGLYGEGTFAAGKTETDFRSWDFMPGTRSKYDFSVPYYSTHITVGQVLSLTDILDFDVYGKYLWTRQEGDNVTMNGYLFKFKDADSHRLRVGGKLQADVTRQLQPYAGGAFEYEFSSRIKGSLYGMNMDKPSLRGGTGIGELGLIWTTDAQNLKVDLGLQGYAGKREGLSGGLTVSLSF